MNPALLLTFGGGLLLTGGDIFMKDWVAKNDWHFFAAGLSLYVAALVALAFSYRFENIAVASLLLVVFNVTTLLLVSYFWFGQAVSPTRLAAMAAALLAVAVLEVTK
jgi:multidrug transporter EmrE-like cation transporter